MKQRIAGDLRSIWTAALKGVMDGCEQSKVGERGAKVAYQRRLRQITCSTVKMASEPPPRWWKNCPGVLQHLC